MSAPAYTFAPGLNTNTSTASDQAGNTSTITTTFTVSVTSASLCNLTRQFVQGSAKYAAATKVQRVAVDLVVAVGCAALNAIRSNTPAKQKATLITAYTASIGLLVPPGWLTSAQASTLTSLTTRL